VHRGRQPRIPGHHQRNTACLAHFCQPAPQSCAVRNRIMPEHNTA
jgi:hypothetical protein